MKKIIYRSDLEKALSKIEVDLNELFMSAGVYSFTALGAHLGTALSAVSSALSYVNQFEES